MPVMSDLEPPTLEYFQRRRLSEVFYEYGRATVLAGAYRVRFAHALGQRYGAVPADARKRLRLARRFAAGGVAGFVAATYALGTEAEAPAKWAYGDVCAFWSTFLLSADGATDIDGLTRDQSRSMLMLCFNRMVAPVLPLLTPAGRLELERLSTEVFGPGRELAPDASSDGAPGVLRSISEIASSTIGDRLAVLFAMHTRLRTQAKFEAGATAFLVRCLRLVAGQLQSLDQRIVDSDRDWGWYRSIADNKMLNVLLALMPLFVSPKHREPGKSLEEGFLLLNRTFFHRQILDDLLDFREDVEDRSANALVYMIVGQARLASALACTPATIDEIRTAISEIDRSRLLDREFFVGAEAPRPAEEEWREVSAWQTRGERLRGEVLRFALVNDHSDLALDVERLAPRAVMRGELLINAWQTKDWEDVVRTVVESKVAMRVLRSIALQVDYAEVNREFERLDDGGLREVLDLVYARMRRTFRKCWAEWQSQGAGA